MNEETKSKKRRLFMKISSLVFLISFILILVLTTYAIGSYRYLKLHGIENLGNRISESEANNIKPWTPDPNYTAKPEDTENPSATPNLGDLKYNTDLYCVLLIGVDTNKERDAHNMGYNSDTLMLIATDVKTYKTYLISIPRDTLATINKLNSKGEVYGTKRTKINAAFSYGHGMKKYSCENACAAVERLLDVPVRNYIALDMEGVGPLTDAIGGVDLVIDADFSKWGMPKGTLQNLKGNKALTYVRERKGVGTGGGDVERTKRQLRFVNAYINKVRTLNPISVLANNYSLMKKYCHTNISYTDLYSYAQLAEKADFNNAKRYSLPGYSDGEYLKLDTNEVSKIRTEVFFK